MAKPAAAFSRLMIAGAAALCLAACSRNPQAVEPHGRTALRFATDWRAEAEQGGFFEALATGQYARRGRT